MAATTFDTREMVLTTLNPITADTRNTDAIAAHPIQAVFTTGRSTSKIGPADARRVGGNGGGFDPISGSGSAITGAGAGPSRFILSPNGGGGATAWATGNGGSLAIKACRIISLAAAVPSAPQAGQLTGHGIRL